MPIEILSGPLSTEVLWRRHDNFWFEDGDIVLSAQLNQDHRELYRVHRLKISPISATLRDALSGSSPTDANTVVYEGLPLFHVLDSAMDLATVLTYAYKFKYVTAFHTTAHGSLNISTSSLDLRVPPYDNSTCNLYSELLRVATNYRVAGLQKELDMQLNSVWPSTLDEWNTRVLHYQAIAARHIPSETPNSDGMVDGQYLDDRLPEPVFAIRLFRTYKLLKYLPTAFYELSMITPTADWIATHEEPQRRSTRSRRLLTNRIRSARWSQVTQEDHMCLHRYFRKIQTQSLTLMPPENELCSGRVCLHGRMYIQLEILHEISRLRDILEVLNCHCQDDEKEKMLNEGVCAQCVQKIVNVLQAKRQHIFDNLGNFFALPSPQEGT
ncbi:hypothetical protein DXG01_001738 [Tephrocybe rancida]|nr:hypothetical protein DXG01_001738 [Tephrocybe rancida]